ncbi:deoxyguanosinetriphosphate triphosphohydrolase [Peptoniphilaceae bacterium SGI.137]
MIREQIEHNEEMLLSPYAVRASQTKGRSIPEVEDPYRTCFQRDRDRILHSKCFRRLKHKTQVFISPEGDHYRTRLTHTLEVGQIARTIARALRLNEDLTEAMAMGHDVGHTPFGHAGEHILQKIMPGFHHAQESVRMLSIVESRARTPHVAGLNLTWEVLDGIANHSGSNQAATLEGRILKFADRIAYVNHDIDDSIRAGVLREEDLPKECVEILGKNSSERISALVHAVVRASMDQPEIRMEEPYQGALRELRGFMFDRVYTNEMIKGENRKLEHIITDLFQYLLEHPEAMPADHHIIYEDREDSPEMKVMDYISGMTDDFLIRTYRELFIPKVWSIL